MEKRPRALPSKTIKAQVGCGNIFVTFTENKGRKPFEIFGQLGKGGQCGRVQVSTVGKLASYALRSGYPPEKIMKTMMGETCDRWDGSPGQCRSCSDAFGRVIAYALGKVEEDLVTPIDEPTP